MLLIDDRSGRAEARHRGLNLIGTAAVIVLAREQGLIGACAPLLHALREQGYSLSDGLIQAVLRQVSEA
jgi:predicted nucleic acid-binding protein